MSSIQEPFLQRAIEAINNDTSLSVRAAARAYSVPPSTLRARIKGRRAQSQAAGPNRLLNDTDEKVIVNWLLNLDARGQPARKKLVEDMVRLILRDKMGRVIPLHLGTKWVPRFLSRHPELRVSFNRNYDYRRAKCEDPKLLNDWFDRVERVMLEKGILWDDVYNFDETGFLMGVGATEKVITASARNGRAVTVHSGNREWVTVIEAINAKGWALKPLIILQGKVHQDVWYDKDALIKGSYVATSTNGWTTDELGLMAQTRF
jgi:hypothetical protein